MLSMVAPELQRIMDAHETLGQLRRSLERELREQLEARISDARDRLAVAAYYGHKSGLSISAIATQGMQTKNRLTARAAIDRGAHLADLTAPSDATSAEFRWTGQGQILVCPDSESLAPVLAALRLEPGEHSATFELVDGRILPVTPPWTAETGRNPVSALVLGPNAEYRERLLNWATRP
jgi:hypothetical protein